MATQVLLEIKPPVIRSILEFNTDKGEEDIFLLYSKGCENGPGIVRDGKGSPWMFHPQEGKHGVKITDPDLQRWGTYFLNKELQERDLRKLQERIAELKKSSKNNFLVKELEELYESNEKQKNYVDIFNENYGDNYEIVAIQGMGDLTMNHWNVAYINDKITKRAEILHLLDEPIQTRSYTCLIKWKEPPEGKPKYEIKDVKFDRYVFNSDRESPYVVQIDNKPVADKIEFAVYGQQLIRPGQTKVVHPKEIAHQFSDIRHIFHLPNLNPVEPLNDKGRPRFYFGKSQSDDIWFGEAEILSNRNLRKAAIVDSIELNRLYSGLGASIEQIEEAMKKANYKKSDNPIMPLRYDKIDPEKDIQNENEIAEWRFVPEDDTLVEIRIRENRYPCTMIGVNEKGKIYLLAWKGIYSSWPGWTLRQAAAKLMSYRVESAILCDEGADVFQYFINNNNSLKTVIEPGRGQVRAVFIVARKKTRKKK